MHHPSFASVQSNRGHYGLVREVPLTFKQAIERIAVTLKDQGFGILTEIDIQKTMKAKLDMDIPPYVIFGACNPPLAYRALSAETGIGLLLPCNVCVYEDPKTGKTIVSAIDPETLVTLTGRSDLEPLANEVRTKLKAALAAV